MNTCNCPYPPGGQVVCEQHQMAVCIVENGQTRHQCLDPVSTKNSTKLLNWALSEITTKRKWLNTALTENEIAILISGRYSSFGRMVTFSLPRNLKNTLEELIKDRGMTNNNENEIEAI